MAQHVPIFCFSEMTLTSWMQQAPGPSWQLGSPSVLEFSLLGLSWGDAPQRPPQCFPKGQELSARGLWGRARSRARRGREAPARLRVGKADAPRALPGVQGGTQSVL